MRYPGPYAQKKLSDLLLGAGFARSRIATFLQDQGMHQVAGLLPAPVNDVQDIRAAIKMLSDNGHITEALIDALEAEPEIVPLEEDLRLLRIEMEFLPPVDTLLSPSELERVKVAARHGQLHAGLQFTRLQRKVPASVRQHACRVAGNDADQLDAWFDGANRQVVGPGDSVRMLDLLDVAIEESKPDGKAGLKNARARVESTVLLGGIEDFPAERTGSLQQVVQEFGIAIDAADFFTRGQVALGRIAKVTIGASDYGTAFLVGPDLIMTNHHVLSGVIAQMKDARDVRFTFDFRTVNGNETSGPTVKLLTDGATDQNPQPWLIDHSPATQEEQQGNAAPIDQQTSNQHLDFALCRIDTRIAESNDTPHGGERGFFPLKTAGPDFVFNQGVALSIIGHPTSVDQPRVCKPQVFAIEPDAVIAINPNNTRVRYRTNTLKGSSGSPVLSVGWQLVALHHYGKKDHYNQGVPIATIAQRPDVAAAIAN